MLVWKTKKKNKQKKHQYQIPAYTPENFSDIKLLVPLPFSPTGPVKVPQCILQSVRWRRAGLPSVLVPASVVMLMMPDEQRQVIVVKTHTHMHTKHDPWLLCTNPFSCSHALMPLKSNVLYSACFANPKGNIHMFKHTSHSCGFCLRAVRLWGSLARWGRCKLAAELQASVPGCRNAKWNL